MTDGVRTNAASTPASRQNADRVSIEGRGAMSDFVAPPNLIEKNSGSITPQMLTLLDLTQEQIDAVVATVPGGARNVQDIYPLTPLQEGMLFHHLLEEDGDAYVLSTWFQLKSRTHVLELANGLQKAIDRHDALRSAIVWDKLPVPLQVVCREATLQMQELTLNRDRNPAEQLKERINTLRGVELGRAPLMRLWTAADPASEHWYAILQRHHIVFDHQSWNIVFAEAMAYVRGHEHELLAPPEFRDYVAWSLAHATSQDAEIFFRRKLEGLDGPSAPFGLIDTSNDRAGLEEARVTLDAALVERLRNQARSIGVGASRLFHAAWAIVVAGTSGRDDVVLGTIVLGARRKTELVRRMVGLFVNTLPLRVRIRDVTVKELIEQTDRELKELLNYQHASPALIQRCAGDGGGAPLFTAVLNYRHSAGHSVVDPGALPAGLKVLAHEYRTNYPVMLVVDDLGEGFTLTVQSDRRAGPGRIAEYTLTALHSLVDALEYAAHTPADELTILPPSERRRLVEVFNGTYTTFPRGVCVHELFESQVGRTPDAIAATYDTQALTYAELNGRANRLARYLRAQGVGADQVVAIAVERSLEMVVGLLGILKAGAAYMPLDPNYPAERLQYMLNDANPRIVLTQASLRDVVLGNDVDADRMQVEEKEAPLSPPRASVLLLDLIWRDVQKYSDNNLPAAEIGLTSRNLVYVIYTSGSTGRPKGTAMAHGAMVNLVEWHRRHLPTDSGQRVLQFAALSFDVAFQETFSTLLTGGTLVMLADEIRRDAGALAEFLNKQSIQRLFVPPLMLQSLAELLDDRSAASLGALRDVITAGEQLRISPEISTFFKQLSNCRLHNHYGPTETHVVTALTLQGDPSEWPGLPTIGRPVANTQIHVLDRRGQLVPTGVVGEVHIGGANVARGYVNRAELTAQRFVADAFSREPGARLYRTGDLGRWREDGTLEYLGRNDDQVKIRGYRIELGEIEAKLLEHEQVSKAAVIAHEHAAAGKRLVAYIAPRDRRSLNVAELREHLSTELPEYMVPSIFMTIPSMPLTPSGKLDRRALPVPDFGAYASQEYEPPQGDIEEVIARIWKKLLGLVRIGRHDNFFHVGGHSLLATRVMTHISQQLDVDLPLRVLFEKPTIEGLSECVLAEISSEVSLEEGL